LLTVHDLTAKLQAKGVPLEHVCKGYEVCNPQQAKAVLDRDLSISTSTVLPRRIAVHDSGKELELAMMNRRNSSPPSGLVQIRVTTFDSRRS
jgi:uncharacterized protein (DUF302 family)